MCNSDAKSLGNSFHCNSVSNDMIALLFSVDHTMSLVETIIAVLEYSVEGIYEKTCLIYFSGTT